MKKSTAKLKADVQWVISDRLAQKVVLIMKEYDTKTHQSRTSVLFFESTPKAKVYARKLARCRQDIDYDFCTGMISYTSKPLNIGSIERKEREVRNRP